MAARKHSLHSKVPFLALEILGFALSAYLFLVSAELIGDKLPCARSKWIACESAVKGPLSHIGPFSVAAMGAIYYIIHLTLTAGLRDRSAQILKVLLVAGGLVFVAWLRALEIVWLKKICPWCWGVALLTLIHAGISYGLAVPPLKRLRIPTLIGLIFVGFLMLVALVTTAELGLKTGLMLLNQGRAKSTTAEKQVDKPQEKTDKPAPKPTATPRPTATPPPTQAAVTPPQPTATPKPPQQALPAEPEIIDIPETRILRNRGFRHAGSGDDVVKIIKARGAILLLVYDPYCDDCHNLIANTLDSQEVSSLPLLKVAIQESMLTGALSQLAGREIPVLMLFNKVGEEAEVLWKHVGSTLTKEQLVEQVKGALARPAGEQQ